MEFIIPNHLTLTGTLLTDLRNTSFVLTVKKTADIIGRYVLFDLQFGGRSRDYGNARDGTAGID